MAGPHPIWEAASKQYVDEKVAECVPEADKDGKMYARKDGAWEEIPAAVTGAFLPLAGGTVTGEITLGNQGAIRAWRMPQNEVEVEMHGGNTPTLQCGSSNIHGQTSLWGNTWIERLITGQYANLQGSEVSVQSGGSLRLASQSDIIQVQAASGVRVEANTQIGTSAAGKSLQVYGDITGNSINTTASVNLNGTAIHIGSPTAGSVFLESGQSIRIATPPSAWSSSITLDSAGGVNIPKNASIGTPYNSAVVIHGGMVQIGCEGSNLELSSTGHVSISPRAHLEETYINGRLYKNGPDGIPILDIPDTNNRTQYPLTSWQNGNQVPQIQIGSSNYKVDFGVNGRLWGNPMVGTLRSWNEAENTYVSMGSGLYIHAGQYHIELRTVVGPMNFYSAQNFNFNGSGFYHTGDLYIQGQAFKPSGGSWQSTSDKRLKSDVEPYEDGLNKLTKLKPIRFRYNERARQAETGKQFVGLAAEEAREVMPSIVGSTKAKLDYEDKEPTDVLTIDPSELIYTVINALKQIDERLKTLEEFWNIDREQ